MLNLTRNNDNNSNLLPIEVTQYTDDNASISPLYNNLQYPYTILDTQHQGQVPNDYSSHLLMPIQHLNQNNNDIINTVTEYTSDKNPVKDTTSTSIYSFQTLGNTSTVNNPTIKINPLRPPERGIAGFVSKLYQCLQAPENGHKYARWCHHNDKDMFVIDCIPRFTDEVLPRLFKHCKFASFVRQLNIYGFQRDTDARKSKAIKDKETCRWYHPYFRPGRRDLFHMIRRKATQNIRQKQMQSIEEDPETILTMDSGDESLGESELGNGSDVSSVRLNQRRHSSVSSVSNLQRDNRLQSTPLEHHRSYEILYHDTPPGDFHPQPESAVAHTPTLYLPPTVQSQVMETSKITPMETNSIVIDLFEPNPEGSSLSAYANNELQLQLQLHQLQTHYTNDRNFYTKQMQLAYTRIERQRAHIEHLEAMSAHQQYQIHTDRLITNDIVTNPNDSAPHYAVKKEPGHYNMYSTELASDPPTQLPNHTFYHPHYADSSSLPSFDKPL